MDKATPRGGHDLMLKRIEESLKEEDRSNARAWTGVSVERRLKTLFDLSDFNRAILRARGAPPPIWDPFDFPGLPRS